MPSGERDQAAEQRSTPFYPGLHRCSEPHLDKATVEQLMTELGARHEVLRLEIEWAPEPELAKHEV